MSVENAKNLFITRMKDRKKKVGKRSKKFLKSSFSHAGCKTTKEDTGEEGSKAVKNNSEILLNVKTKRKN